MYPERTMAGDETRLIRQQIAFATSSGLPRRFIGCMAEIDALL